MMLAGRGWVVAGVVALALGGCTATKQPAPVVERSPELVRRAPASKPATAPARADADTRPETYTVKRGDTLYGIALDHGQDYRDLVRWNNIANPNVIEVGQVLRVRGPAPHAAAAQPGSGASSGVVTTPYQSAPVAEGREMGVQPSKPAVAEKRALPAEPAQDSSVVSTPKAAKVPYSDAALASMRAAPTEGTPPIASAPAPAVSAPAPAQGAEAPRADTGPTAGEADADAVSWAWPTAGKVVASFNENGGPKGVQIAGEMGQPVVASAGGRVVYTGSGLRGYGNLVIIKHNNTYLSAYAHNRSVLVKQGDNVTKGQKIAEMGSTDASRVMLHFEIRRLGKPVDPMKFLPPA